MAKFFFLGGRKERDGRRLEDSHPQYHDICLFFTFDCCLSGGKWRRRWLECLRCSTSWSSSLRCPMLCMPMCSRSSSDSKNKLLPFIWWWSNTVAYCVSWLDASRLNSQSRTSCSDHASTSCPSPSWLSWGDEDIYIYTPPSLLPLPLPSHPPPYFYLPGWGRCYWFQVSLPSFKNLLFLRDKEQI